MLIERGKTMKTHYLIYVYRGEIKIRQCKRTGRSFEPIENTGKIKYYHTNLPDGPMILQHGKIYCETLGDVPECVRIMKNHYKDRVLQLERSVLLGKMVIND